MIHQLFYILLVIQTLVLGFLGLIYEPEAWDITSFGSAYLHAAAAATSILNLIFS